MHSRCIILIQGPFDPQCLDWLETYRSFGEPWIACWAGDRIPPGTLPEDLPVVRAEHPDPFSNRFGLLHFTSTLAGLRALPEEAEWVIKVRSDEYYTNLWPVLEACRAHPEKLITNNIFFRFDGDKKYHPSDHLVAGRRSRLETVFSRARERALALHRSDSKTRFFQLPEQILGTAAVSLRETVDPQRSVEQMREAFGVVPVDRLGDYSIVAKVYQSRGLPDRFRNNFHWWLSDAPRGSIRSMDELDQDRIALATEETRADGTAFAPVPSPDKEQAASLKAFLRSIHGPDGSEDGSTDPTRTTVLLVGPWRNLLFLKSLLVILIRERNQGRVGRIVLLTDGKQMSRFADLQPMLKPLGVELLLSPKPGHEQLATHAWRRERTLAALDRCDPDKPVLKMNLDGWLPPLPDILALLKRRPAPIPKVDGQPSWFARRVAVFEVGFSILGALPDGVFHGLGKDLRRLFGTRHPAEADAMPIPKRSRGIVWTPNLEEAGPAGLRSFLRITRTQPLSRCLMKSRFLADPHGVPPAVLHALGRQAVFLLRHLSLLTPAPDQPPTALDFANLCSGAGVGALSQPPPEDTWQMAALRREGGLAWILDPDGPAADDPRTRRFQHAVADILMGRQGPDMASPETLEALTRYGDELGEPEPLAHPDAIPLNYPLQAMPVRRIKEEVAHESLGLAGSLGLDPQDPVAERCCGLLTRRLAKGRSKGTCLRIIARELEKAPDGIDRSAAINKLTEEAKNLMEPKAMLEEAEALLRDRNTVGTGIEYLKRAVRLGDPDAVFLMGKLLMDGGPVPMDLHGACRHLNRAAKAGHPKAAALLKRAQKAKKVAAQTEDQSIR